MIRFLVIEESNKREYEDRLEECVNNGWEIYDTVLDTKVYLALLGKEDDES